MALDSVRKGSHLSPLCMCVCVGVFVSAAGKKTSRNKKSKRNMLLIFFDLFLQFFICILCFCRTHTSTHRKTHKRLKLPITRHTHRHTHGRAGQTDRLGATQSELAKPRTLSPPAFVSLSLSLFNWLKSRAMAECLATLPRSPRSLPLPLPQAREQHSLLPGSCFVDWHTHTHTHPDSGAYGVTCQCWH